MLFNSLRSGIFRAFRYKNIDKRSTAFRLKDISSRHIELSAVYSDTYKYAKPTKRLFNILQAICGYIQEENFDFLEGRKNLPPYVFEFPGEHYLCLKALVKAIAPKHVVEIGTFTGLSAIALQSALGSEGTLTTVDIVEWDKIDNTCLEDRDFTQSGRMKQVIADFSDRETVDKYSELFKTADLIFCDGPKDGSFEKNFLLHLENLKIKQGCILFFDDIRQWNMLKIWHDLKMPKLDITSVGHFTGSGLVEWDNSKSCF